MDRKMHAIETLPDFLSQLAKCLADERQFAVSAAGARELRLWYTNTAGSVRTTCPITAVAYRLTGWHYSMGQYEAAAVAIGLPMGLAHQIAQAADHPRSPVGDIRDALCRALGL